jgi:hypothetical protein
MDAPGTKRGKENMKRLTLAATTLTLMVVLLLSPHALAKKGGTSILHLMLRASMTGDGSGSVELKRNQQGGADNQRLQITLADLAADTTYQLLAVTATGTNALEFTTDSAGGASWTFVKKNRGKAHPGGDLLPAELDPVTNLRRLEISLGGTQTVLSADLTMPDAFQYLVKRPMTNDGLDTDAAASLRIKSNGVQDQLRIRASGLDATGTYFLAINGDIADTLTSDAAGKLNVTAWPAGSPHVLDVTALAIWDAASNSVLSTTLP